MEASRGLEDYIPVIVAVTVDFFSALFVSVCISSSGSILLSALLIAVDLGQIMLEFREVKDNSKTVLALWQDLQVSTQDNKTSIPGNSDSTYLLTRILAVTRNPAAFDIVSLKRTRLWACLPHPITSEQTEVLNALETSSVYGPRGLISRRKRSRARRKSRNRVQRTSIVPAPINTRLRSEGSTCAADVQSNTQGGKSRELVTQGLQLLFHCEYLALVEYVECVIPLVFAINKLILEELPNVVYYPGGAGKWVMAALANVFVYATLEICSLLLLNHFLQRNFSFSPLYQLAFALESSRNFVQGTLFLEIVGLLQYELMHLDADFTFRFEWLRENNGS
ncbi:hypothetical protein PF010_g13042 [Phytophthora fragariae]|nr:hypothetical protein PF010_g13042 [Phytophthora fragariae]KAE9108746.1 hypothetical protein PF007_g12533 [Phytophthora fragariae]KAE9197227.1 hypothetical protein PF004_g19892 [Phytophthora fragariae]KAE9242424.1 hypothetical protein PF002_g8759 [Phytophthora fragariae]